MRPNGHGELEIFGQFHIFGKFTKDHLADLSRLLGLVGVLSYRYNIYVTVRKEFQFFLIFWCTLMYNVVQFLDSARVSQVPGWIGEADYCVIIHIIKLTACL